MITLIVYIIASVLLADFAFITEVFDWGLTERMILIVVTLISVWVDLDLFFDGSELNDRNEL